MRRGQSNIYGIMKTPNRLSGSPLLLLPSKCMYYSYKTHEAATTMRGMTGYHRKHRIRCVKI